MRPLDSWHHEGSFFACSPAPGVRVFVLPTQKFKTTTVEVHAHHPLGGGAARNALLALLLRHGTDRCSSSVAVTRRLEEMFGAALGFDLYKLGERQVLTLHLQLVQDRFSERGLFASGIRWLGELLLEGRSEGRGGFEPRVFEQEVAELRRRIDGAPEDPACHAIERLVSILCEGEPFARGELGEPGELDAIDPAGMVEYFETWRHRTPVDWYVVGDVDPDEVVDGIVSCLPESRASFDASAGFDRASVDGFSPPARRVPERVRHHREAAPFGQSWIATGLRIPESVDPVGALYVDALLAGGPCSRLFREVRSREGIAYRVESGLEQIKGLWMVRAGVTPGREEDAVALVLEGLDDLGRRRVPAEELEGVRAAFIARARSIEDDPVGLIRSDLLARMAGKPLSVEASIRRHLALTSETVERTARDFGVDTILVLDSASDPEAMALGRDSGVPACA